MESPVEMIGHGKVVRVKEDGLAEIRRRVRKNMSTQIMTTEAKSGNMSIGLILMA